MSITMTATEWKYLLFFCAKFFFCSNVNDTSNKRLHVRCSSLSVGVLLQCMVLVFNAV